MDASAPHLLITVSDDPGVFFGLRFTCRFFADKKGIRVTLFCCPPSPEAAMLENDASGPNPRERMESAVREALEMLRREGFPESSVTVKCLFGGEVLIDDIAAEADTGKYDALVMGRRGLNRLWTYASDRSVSRGIFDKRLETPLWICRAPDLDRRNVLLCVNGSDSAMRMVDHVGALLTREERHNVTLCRIVENFERRRDETMELFDRCQERLGAAGVAAQRVRRMIYPSSDVVQAICDNADWGRFAVVAAGRVSRPPSRLGKVLLGTVAGELFNRLTGAVLWLCP